MTSFFRYPGGKNKFKSIILQELNSIDINSYDEYREVFFGGGSIGLDIIANEYPHKIWINDKDIGIAMLWKSVANFPEQLKYKINTFIPSVKAFDDIKEFFLNDPKITNDDDIVQIGFNKLCIHQLSFSGLGMKSGGPLGGRDQNSKYPIDCRWSPKTMCKKIDNIHTAFNKKNITITYNDFSDVITNTNSALLYLDPPYYDKGNELYHHSFNENDHIRLCDLLKNTKNKWVLSYDSVPEIHDLYSWATIKEINANYTISGSTKKTELLIFNKDHIPNYKNYL